MYLFCIRSRSVREGGVHQADIDRIRNRKKWLRLFLEYNDLDQKASLAQLWGCCIFRKENNLNGSYPDNGQ